MPLPRDQQSGGVGFAGSRGKLNIVVFGPGSSFDLVISSGLGPSEPGRSVMNRTLFLSSFKGRTGILSRA